MSDKRQTTNDKHRSAGIPEELQKLLQIVAQLRHPTKGCPWDKEQTLESIQDHIVLEAEEAKEAIAHGDMENLQEELGDVLFNILLQAQIAEETKKFSFLHVLQSINRKLTERHPHVFGGGPMPKDAKAAIDQWNRLKKS